MMDRRYINDILQRYEKVLTSFTGVELRDKPVGWERYRRAMNRGQSLPVTNVVELHAASYAEKHAMASNLIDAAARAYKSGKLSPEKEARNREVLISWHAPIAVAIVCRNSAGQKDPDEFLSTALMSIGKCLDAFDAERYQWGWGSRGYITTAVNRAIWKQIQELSHRSEISLDDRDGVDELDYGSEAPERPEDLSWVFKLLDDREKVIIRGIYFEHKSRGDLTKELGLSNERIRQIINLTIKKIRKAMPEMGGMIRKIQIQLEFEL